MNLNEIRNFLKDLFSKPLCDGRKRHIVFWYDKNEDFIEEIDDFDLEEVKVIKLNENNAFYTKYYIEKEDTLSNILVYSNMKKPNPNEDWLYDIFCYSEEFSTDRATVIMREVGVTNPVLKEEFKLYNTFFENKVISKKVKCYFEDSNGDYDRMHFYLSGWEIPKMKSELITNSFGFITDY